MSETPKKLWPFECHGVDFHSQSGNQRVGCCPFCDDNNHLYADQDTTQWDCKKCGRKGNVYSFLEQIWKFHYDQTTATDYRRLAANRNLPIRALRRFKLAYTGEQWLVPCFSDKGTIRDLRRWSESKRRLMSTRGCPTQLFGLQRLKDSDTSKDAWVWLCEGEWDVMAMSELLAISGYRGDIVLGVPGADILKDEWIPYFKGRKVRICYDNDEAGDRGSLKAGKLLKGIAKQIEYLNWSETLPKGYDLRDFTVAALLSDDENPLGKFKELFSEKHRRGTTDEKPDETFDIVPKGERPTFPELVDFLSQRYYMDEEMVNGLRLTLAVCLSEQMAGPPLWLQLIAPPGGGKTLLLALTSTSDRTVFRSTITAHGLVSGWQGSREDPSLLAHVDKKVLVIKDGTEILALPAFQQDEIWAIFRGAYDGSVSRNFGNNVTREYVLHFSLLMGVTPAIEAHPRATLGDRFLRYHIRSKNEASLDERIIAAINDDEHNPQFQNESKEEIRKFLAQDIRDVPPLPDWAKIRLLGLSKLIALLRTNIDRKPYEPDNITHRPQEEIATRLAQQIAKLIRALCLVDGENVVCEKHYALAERVAVDTAIGFNVEIIRAILSGKNRVSDMEQLLGITNTTITRRLQDLMLLKIVQRAKSEDNGQGRPAWIYGLTRRVAERWAVADIKTPLLRADSPAGAVRTRVRRSG